MADITLPQELGYGLARGYAGLRSGLGKMIELAASQERDAEFGRAQQRYWEHVASQYPGTELPSPYDDISTLLEPRFWLGGLGEMAPSLATPVGAYGLAAKLGGGLLARSLAGGLAGGALEGAGTAQDVGRAGGDLDAQRQAFLEMTGASGALNALPLAQAFGPGGLLKRVVGGGLAEGVTEAAEEPISHMIATGASLPEALEATAPAMATVGPLAAVTGGVLGGIGGATRSGEKADTGQPRASGSLLGALRQQEAELAVAEEGEDYNPRLPPQRASEYFALPARTEQMNAADIGRQIESRAQMRNGGVLEETEENLERFAELAAADVEQALKAEGKAGEHWYGMNLQAAHHLAELEYPGLLKDPVKRAVLSTATAITSNGTAVADNARYALEQLDHFERTGRFLEQGRGESANQQARGFRLANQLIDEMGVETFTQFLNTRFTVAELNALGLKSSGELVAEEVPGSHIFGPKIGGAFFANLEGYMDRVTMDRWYMRTWGRWKGQVMRLDPEAIEPKIARFQRSVRKPEARLFGVDYDRIKADPEYAKEAARIVYGKWARGIGGTGGSHPAPNEFRRAARELKKEQEELLGTPLDRQRPYLRRAMARAAELLKGRGIDTTPADMQALLWYLEKDLYAHLGYRGRGAAKVSYADAFKAEMEARGHGERAIRVQLKRAERAGLPAQGPGLSQADRAGLVAHRALLRVRGPAHRRNQKPPRGFARRARGRLTLVIDGASYRLPSEAVHKPTTTTANGFTAGGITTTEYHELEQTREARTAFSAALASAKRRSRHGRQFRTPTAGELNGAKLYITEDGSVGFAIKERRLLTMFNAGGIHDHAFLSAGKLAVDEGARALTAPSSVLLDLYAQNGFEVLERTPGSRTLEMVYTGRRDFFRGPSEGVDEGVAGPRPTYESSPRFKSWFEGSKVVDANGDPAVQYHYTEEDFDVWEQGDIGYHFGTQKQANDRGRARSAPEGSTIYGSAPPHPTNTGGRVLPVYLSIKKPLETTDMGSMWNHPTGWWDFLSGRFLPPAQLDDPGNIGHRRHREALRQIPDELKERLIAVVDDWAGEFDDLEGQAAPPDDRDLVRAREDFADAIRFELELAGYDGLRYLNLYEGETFGGQSLAPNYSWVAFENDQIRPVYVEVRQDGEDYAERQLELFDSLDAAMNAPPAKPDGRPRPVLIANAISAEAREKGVVNLLGKQVRGPDDLAVLAQVYRDPRWETLRYFFVDDQGEIVHQIGVSARLPGSAGAFPAGLQGMEGFQWIAEQMDAAGATGVWVQHNHPSGSTKVSDQDTRLTQNIATYFGSKFRGHVVINHNEYSYYWPGYMAGHWQESLVLAERIPIPPDAQTDVDPLLTPSKDHPLLGTRISGPDRVVDIGRAMQKPGFATLIGRGQGVRGLMDLPMWMFKPENRGRLKAAISRFARRTGSNDSFIAVPDEQQGFNFNLKAHHYAMKSLLEGGFITDGVVYLPAGGAVRGQGVTTPYAAPAVWSAHEFFGERSRLMDYGRMAHEMTRDVGEAPRLKGKRGKTWKHIRRRARARGYQVPPASQKLPSTVNEEGVAAPRDPYYDYTTLGDTRRGADTLMADVDRMFTDARKKAGRGNMKLEELDRLGAALNVAPEDLAKRAVGKVWNAEKIRAAIAMIEQSAVRVKERALQAQRTGSADDKQKFYAAFLEHISLQIPFRGLASEAGRALRVFADESRRSKTYRELLEQMGVEQRIDVLAAGIAELESTGQISGFAREAYRARAIDVILEVWINALLSGPQTHAVNVFSNTLVQVLTTIEGFVAAGTSKHVSFAEAAAYANGSIQGAFRGLRLARDAFRTEEGSSAGSKVEAPRQRSLAAEALGLEGLTGKAVDKIGRAVRIPGRALMAGDEFFKSIGYIRMLHALATREGVLAGLAGQQLADHVRTRVENPSFEMEQKARKHADYVTFTNKMGPIGSAISRVAQEHPMLRFIAPFIRTPSNIVKFALARSPLGIWSKEFRDAYQQRGADPAGWAVARARVLTGSSIMALAAYYALEGSLTGGGPDDPRERALWYANGNQPYSVRINGTWYAYGRLEPLGMLLGIAADAAAIAHLQPEKDVADVMGLVVTSIGKNLLSKTWLRGVSEVLTMLADPDRYGEKWVSNFLGTLVPTGVAQVARTRDPYLREARGIVDTWKSRIPGLRETLPIRHNLFGQGVRLEGGLGPDIVSPIYTRLAKQDPIASELERLDVTPAVAQRNFQGAELSGEEYQSLVKFQGGIVQQALRRLMSSAAYQRMPTYHQRRMVELTITRARSAARIRWVLAHPEVLRRGELAKRQKFFRPAKEAS